MMFERLNEKCGFEIVIPAKAGIRSYVRGFRLKAGMTLRGHPIENDHFAIQNPVIK